MKYEEDTLICGACGSDNIGSLSVSNPNTDEHIYFLDEEVIEENHYCFNDDCKVETLDELTSYTNKGESNENI